MIEKKLEKDITYLVGDLIIKIINGNRIRITTDKGTVIVRPKSDNAVIVESSTNIW